MKMIRIETLFISLILTASFFSGAQKAYAEELPSVPGELIVKYKTNQSPEDIQKNVERRQQNNKKLIIGPIQNVLENIGYALRKEKTPETALQDISQAGTQANISDSRKLFTEGKLKNIQLLKARTNVSGKDLQRIYSKLSQVQYAQPNYIASSGAVLAATTPNDPYFSQEWYLSKTQAVQAWDISQGSDSIVVAVLDTGIDAAHPDLQGKVVSGYNFVSSNTNTSDDNWHGTAVAGIIGAITNNGVGICSVGRQVKLMAVKVLDNHGSGAWTGILNGIKYAADNGARVINLSIHSTGASCSQVGPAMQDAIDYARSKGSVVVAIAGNYGQNASLSIPGSCTGVINVGGTNSTDQRALFPDSTEPGSNYGSLVDVSAPAIPIVTLQPHNINGGYCTGCWGTSFAGPQVSAAVALVLSVNPDLTADQVKDILKNNADPITTDQPIGKRLNIYKSLLAALPTIDTLNYFLGTNHPLDKGLTGSHPLSQLIDPVQKRAYYSKWADSSDPAGFSSKFEVYTWDDSNIYLKEDHSGSPVPYYSFTPGTWMKRQMKVGDKIPLTPPSNNQIQVYNNSCQSVASSTPLVTGAFPIELTLEKRNPNFNIYTYLGQTQPTSTDYISNNLDVIVLKYDSSPSSATGIYEKFYYSKEWGWILWEEYSKATNAVTNRSYFTQIVSTPLQPMKEAVCTPELRPPAKQALFGVIPVCNISSASWTSSSNPVIEGTPVTLSVQTSGTCDGRQVEFKVWEDDGILGSDAVRINPGPVTITNNAANATWASEYQCDGFLCLNDPPEYYFEANIAGKSIKVRSSQPEIQVTKVIVPTPSPSPSASPQPSLPPVSLSHSPKNPTTNDTITFSVTANSSVGIKSIAMYAAGTALTQTCTSTSTSKTCTATNKFTTAGQIGYAVDVFDNAGKYTMASEIFQVIIASSPLPSPSLLPSPSPSASPIPSPTPAPKRPPCGGYGDVTLDGLIAQQDIDWISDQVAGKRSFTEEQKKKADVNGDNMVNINDVQLIQRYLTASVVNFDICSQISIAYVILQSIAKDSAIITWSTNAPSTSKVIYGTSRTNLNLSFPQTSPYSISHSITVSQLQANTLYFYKVQSQNGAGLVESALGVFRTKP